MSAKSVRRDSRSCFRISAFAQLSSTWKVPTWRLQRSEVSSLDIDSKRRVSCSSTIENRRWLDLLSMQVVQVRIRRQNELVSRSICRITSSEGWVLSERVLLREASCWMRDVEHRLLQGLGGGLVDDNGGLSSGLGANMRLSESSSFALWETGLVFLLLKK